MSQFGRVFRVTTFGESHGAAVGCVCDGVPPGMSFSAADVQPLLDRRRPGASSITTLRSESDQVEVLSGVESGFTLGTPIAMLVRNQDARHEDYKSVRVTPRPGHADYTYFLNAIALKYLREKHGVSISCFVSSVLDVRLPELEEQALVSALLDPAEVDARSCLWETSEGLVSLAAQRIYSAYTGLPIRDLTQFTRDTSARIAAEIHRVAREEDSAGGCMVLVIGNLPAGLGEPVFDKFHAVLAHGLMSIPAVKGVEVGEGFRAARMQGSAHNDCFEGAAGAGRLGLRTNHCGGLLGGLTVGGPSAPVVVRVAVKPASSIAHAQETCTMEGAPHQLRVVGRHDPCVLPRAPPIVEAMAALVTMDFLLLQLTRN